MKRARRSNFKTSKKIRLDKDQPLDDVKKTEERVQLKKLYAKLLAKDITDKPKLVGKCLTVIGDDLQGAVRRHDTCRVVQMCLKHGNKEQQAVILDEMVGIFRELACSKYAIHLAAKVFKLSQDKETLAFALIPDARKIISQKEGSKFVQVLYDTKYRTALMKSLFGGSESPVDSSHLRDFLDSEGQNLAAVGRLVSKCLAKELQGLAVVQVVILEYVECLTDKSAKFELLTRLQSCLLTLMDGRAGVRLAILTLSASDNKARKAILKNIKGHLSQLCQGEYSFLFVIKLLNVVDDTKRIGNLVSSDVCQDLESITGLTQGVKVLDSLMFETWKKRLSQSEWELLEEDLNQVSKKDANVRRTEVLKYVLPRLSVLVRERVRDFIVDSVHSSLVLGIAESVVSGLWSDSQFVEEVASLVRVGDIASNAVSQRVLKKIVETEAESGSSQFAEKMIAALRSASKGKILKSRGVWILVALAEKSLLRKEFKGLFESEDLASLEAGQKGEQALLAALRSS